MIAAVWWVKAVRYIAFGLVLLLVAGNLFFVGVESALAALPNHDYIPEILQLKEEGRLDEARAMARYVLQHPDLPRQEEAKVLEEKLTWELDSWWGRAKRAGKGFITGSGKTPAEIVGAMSSDLLIWGDVRDLLKEGWHMLTGQETDPVVVALAGIGLLTGAIPAADGAMSLLKVFRKLGVLSAKFVDFVVATAKKSAKMGKLDDGLKMVFRSLHGLVDKMGKARTATVMKYVDDPVDLARISSVARKNADVAYLTVRNGGPDGVRLIRALGDSDMSVHFLAEAAKKGPKGIQWLNKNKYWLGLHVVFGFAKNLWLGRIQDLVRHLLCKFIPCWLVMVLALAGAVYCFFKAWKELFGSSARRPSDGAASPRPQPSTS